MLYVTYFISPPLRESLYPGKAYPFTTNCDLEQLALCKKLGYKFVVVRTRAIAIGLSTGKLQLLEIETHYQRKDISVLPEEKPVVLAKTDKISTEPATTHAATVEHNRAKLESVMVKNRDSLKVMVDNKAELADSMKFLKEEYDNKNTAANRKKELGELLKNKKSELGKVEQGMFDLDGEYQQMHDDLAKLEVKE